MSVWPRPPGGSLCSSACCFGASFEKVGREVRCGRSPLVQKVSPVERIALLRDKAGIANKSPKLLLGGAVMGSGRGDNIFLDHDAAHVVPAEAQS